MSKIRKNSTHSSSHQHERYNCEGYAHMHDYCVQFKAYSVINFDYITMFEVMYCWTSIRAGPIHACGCMNMWCIKKHVWYPLLTKVEQYSALNAEKYVTEWFLHGTATHICTHTSDRLKWKSSLLSHRVKNKSTLVMAGLMPISSSTVLGCSWYGHTIYFLTASLYIMTNWC